MCTACGAGLRGRAQPTDGTWAGQLHTDKHPTGSLAFGLPLPSLPFPKQLPEFSVLNTVSPLFPWRVSQPTLLRPRTFGDIPPGSRLSPQPPSHFPETRSLPDGSDLSWGGWVVVYPRDICRHVGAVSVATIWGRTLLASGE